MKLKVNGKTIKAVALTAVVINPIEKVVKRSQWRLWKPSTWRTPAVTVREAWHELIISYRDKKGKISTIVAATSPEYNEMQRMFLNLMEQVNQQSTK